MQNDMTGSLMLELKNHTRKRKMPLPTEKRKQLEENILKMFKKSALMKETKESGISKYMIKRALILNNKDFKVGINTIKSIVDKFVEEGTVECVNPELKSHLKFRLKEVKDER